MSKFILLGANWCPVTKVTRELFERLKKEESDFDYQYIDIDSEEGKELVKKFSVTDVPKTIFDDKIIFHGKPSPQKIIQLTKENSPSRPASKKAMGLGLKAGIIASLCCIIPLILIIFGLASASVALKFVQYKLYFIALSIIFLVGSLWYFFKRRACCSPEKGKISKKWFIGIALGFHLLTFLILLYVLMPTISPFLYNLSSEKTEASIVNNFSNLRQLTLKTSGMTCSSCAAGIKYNLENLPGVIKAEVSFYQSRATITYASNKVSSKEILESEIFSNSSPYQAKIIEDKSLD